MNVTNIPSSYSTRLTGTANEKYGLAKSLSVMPGDIITTEVFAKYVDTNTNNWNAVLTNLMSTIASGTAPAGTFVDGGAAGSIGGGTFPFIGTLSRAGDAGTGPKAYLNYLIFDKNYVYKTGGFKRLSATPKENGTDVAHERLAFDAAQQITITEAGYVYIYISNENDTPVEVYFDDFKVTHTKGAIVSSQEYYPFGLAFNSYQRENSMRQDFQYNGKEQQDELNLGWMDYGARMYDAQIGRWNVLDPKTQESRKWSPYHYAYNNPVRYTDPDGMSAEDNSKDAQPGVTFQGYAGLDENGQVAGRSSGGATKSTTVSKATFGKAWSSYFHQSGGASKNVAKAYGRFVKNFVQTAGSGGAGSIFASKDDAALDWGMKYNDNSIVEKKEFNSTIYKKGIGYSYTKPMVGDETGSNRSRSGIGRVDVGEIHSHSNYILRSDDNFSPDDIAGYKSKGFGWDGYLTTPMGALYRWGVIEPLSIGLPSDPNSQGNGRFNSIDANNGSKNEPVFGLMDWLKLLNPD